MRQKDYFQFRQFTIDQRHAAMKVGTDSDLLGALAGVPELSTTGSDKSAMQDVAPYPYKILDIGTGTGVLSLMMAQRCPAARITAIEIDENAVIDAKSNFMHSAYADRITLLHTSFQDYLSLQGYNPEAVKTFDSILCNPPYFDKSLECNDLSRTRARHTSSLPFPVLIEGAYSLLREGGLFSVCIPPEVLDDFSTQCLLRGFWLQDVYKVKSVPDKEPKRYVLVHRKGQMITPHQHNCCMRNADRTRSDWYNELMKPFHLL